VSGLGGAILFLLVAVFCADAGHAASTAAALAAGKNVEHESFPAGI